MEPPHVTIHSAPSIQTSAICRPCPSGRYGASEGLETSDCSGTCEAGYFCIAGSISPKNEACNQPGYHCPPGTFEKRKTIDGYVSVPNGTTSVSFNLQSMEMRLNSALAQQPTGWSSFDHPTSFTKATLNGRHLNTVRFSSLLCNTVVFDISKKSQFIFLRI